MFFVILIYMQFLTLESVGLATLTAFVFSFVWYVVFFEKAWLVGEGITKHELPKRSKWYMIQINVYSFLAHGALTSVVALMFDLLQISTLKTAISLGLLFAFGFMVSTHFIDMLFTVHGEHFRRQNQIKFLVSSGYYITMIILVSTVLFLVV